MRPFTIVNPYPLWSYLRAGCFLHVITLAELALLCMVSSYFSGSSSALADADIFLKLILISFFPVLLLFSQLDARSRYQNYKQLKDQLFLYGFDRRIFKPILGSRCQRDAALAASEELGYGNKCRTYFKTCGYRWYHLTPDFIFQTPYFLMTRAFWRRTFFAPTYRRKVDFIIINEGTLFMPDRDVTQ